MEQYLKRFFGKGKQIDRSDGSTVSLSAMRDFATDRCLYN